MKYPNLYSDVKSTLDKCLYVDDLSCSAPSVQTAVNLTKQAKIILQDAGMNLCKWSTNTEELNQLWNDTMEDTISGNVEGEKHCVKSSWIDIENGAG